jgi:hypothetical protein
MKTQSKTNRQQFFVPTSKSAMTRVLMRRRIFLGFILNPDLQYLTIGSSPIPINYHRQRLKKALDKTVWPYNEKSYGTGT